MKDKLFEVSGVLRYAHCFSAEVMAKNPKDAKRKVEENLEKHIDSTMAEYEDATVDLGEEVEETTHNVEKTSEKKN